MTTHQPVEREVWDRLIDSLHPDAPLALAVMAALWPKR